MVLVALDLQRGADVAGVKTVLPVDVGVRVVRAFGGDRELADAVEVSKWQAVEEGVQLGDGCRFEDVATGKLHAIRDFFLATTINNQEPRVGTVKKALAVANDDLGRNEQIIDLVAKLGGDRAGLFGDVAMLEPVHTAWDQRR